MVSFHSYFASLQINLNKLMAHAHILFACRSISESTAKYQQLQYEPDWQEQ